MATKMGHRYLQYVCNKFTKFHFDLLITVRGIDYKNTGTLPRNTTKKWTKFNT